MMIMNSLVSQGCNCSCQVLSTVGNGPSPATCQQLSETEWNQPSNLPSFNTYMIYTARIPEVVIARQQQGGTVTE